MKQAAAYFLCYSFIQLFLLSDFSLLLLILTTVFMHQHSGLLPRSLLQLPLPWSTLLLFATTACPPQHTHAPTHKGLASSQGHAVFYECGQCFLHGSSLSLSHFLSFSISFSLSLSVFVTNKHVGHTFHVYIFSSLPPPISFTYSLTCSAFLYSLNISSSCY